MSRFSTIFLLVSAVLVFSFSSAAAQTSKLQIYTARDGLAGNSITAIAFEPNGSAWIGTTAGATHISNAGWVSYTRAHGLGDSWVTAIAVAPDNRIWFGTQSGGVSVLNPNSKTLTTYNLANSDIPSNFVTALAMDTQNRVWVGTLQNGVAQFDGAQNKWTQYSLPNKQVTTISLEDDLPWVGTESGVYHFDGKEWTQDKTVGSASVQRIDAFDGNWYLTSGEQHFVLGANGWRANDSTDEITNALDAASLTDGQITAFGKDEQQRVWLGTPRGIWMLHNGNAPMPPKPLPVVLIHGWTAPPKDTLEDSEFRFLKSYADQDGIPMYYVRGVSPNNTLYQNATIIRDAIARVKKATGADKVNLIAFSMGGMNTRAYLESSLYQNDVNRAIILGTPQAGVEMWKPILAEQIIQKHDQPSAIELSPEYAQLVNETRAPNASIPYDLLIGDARQQAGLDFLKNLPASDALITVNSALALDAPNVRKHVNSNLHDWSPQAVPLDLTGYLYPQTTWERYLRNALRNNDNTPIGSEIQTSPLSDFSQGTGNNNTPVVTDAIGAGTTVTRTVVIDQNNSARFIAHYPGGAVNFSLVAPDGKRYEPSALPTNESGVLSLTTDIASFSGYVIQNAPIGTWQLILKRTDTGRAPLNVSTYAELDAPRRIEPFEIPFGMPSGQPREIRVNAPHAGSVTARIAIPSTTPGGAFTFTDLVLYDDGQHNDNHKNDGTFGNSFTPDHPGWYVVQITARGQGWERATEQLFQVNPADAQLLPDAKVKIANNHVTFDIGIQAERAGQYLFSAWLMGPPNPSRQQLIVPVKLQVGENRVPISFDSAVARPGSYSLELILLDGNWAALWTDERQLQVTIPPS